MNILVVAHYQNDSSPTAIFIHDQVKAYVALGHRVRVIVPIPLGKCGFLKKERFRSDMNMVDGVEHFFVRYLSLSNYGVGGFNTRCAIAAIARQYDRLLADFVPDIIHAHTIGFDSDIGAWLKSRLHVPLVVTTHGSDTSSPYEKGKLDWLLEKANAADHVVAVSSVLAEKLKSCGTKTPVSVILNGFCVQALHAEEEKTSCSLIQVGHLIAQKHFDTTMQAFALLKEAYPDACLTIIGQGAEQTDLERLAQELGVSESVRFTGQLPNEAVLVEMARAQFFCMPSVREGFGIVYLEAMASGCITIGTEGEGIADLIKHGRNGFLVPAEDPAAIAKIIEWCLTHQQEAAAIAQRGKQDAMVLTWEDNAKKYLDLFQTLIEREIIHL